MLKTLWKKERNLYLPGIKSQHFGRQENILVNQTELSRHGPIISNHILKLKPFQEIIFLCRDLNSELICLKSYLPNICILTSRCCLIYTLIQNL